MRLSNIVTMKYIWLIIFLILPIVGVLYTAWRMWHLLPFSIAMKWVAVGVLVVWFSTIFIAFSGALEKMPLLRQQQFMKWAFPSSSSCCIW